MVPLLQFFFARASLISYVPFVLSCMFLTPSSFHASGGLCFLIVALSSYFSHVVAFGLVRSVYRMRHAKTVSLGLC